MSELTYYLPTDLATTGETLTSAEWNALLGRIQTEFYKRTSLTTGCFAVPTLSITGTTVFCTSLDVMVCGQRTTTIGSVSFTSSQASGTYYLQVNGVGTYSANAAPNAALLTLGTVVWDGASTLDGLVVTATIGLATVGTTGNTTLTLPFRGTWISGNIYNKGDVVTLTVTSITSSYICTTAHTASSGNTPPGSNWALLASGGAMGATGAPGPAPLSRGIWQSGTSYALNDLVVATTADGSGSYNSYVCIAANTGNGTNAPVSGASANTYWALYVKGGPQGATGTAQAYADTGIWANGITYTNSTSTVSLVHYNNDLYRCVMTHTASTGVNEPGTSGGATYWALFIGHTPATGVLNFRTDAWAVSNTYALFDTIFHNGGTAYCVVAHTASSSNEPFVGATWQTNWYPFCLQGTAGANGASVVGYGTWASGVSYPVGALVADTSGGGTSGLYVCTVAHTSSGGTEPYLDSTHWLLQFDYTLSTASYATTAGMAQSISQGAISTLPDPGTFVGSQTVIPVLNTNTNTLEKATLTELLSSSAVSAVIPYAVDSSSSANTIVATFSPPITTLTDGQIVSVLPVHANTTSTAFKHNGTGSTAHDICQYAGINTQTLNFGRIQTNIPILLQWVANGLYWLIVSENEPSTSAMAWSSITGKPYSFAPDPHASSHGTAGSDPVTITPTQAGLGNVTNDAQVKASQLVTTVDGSSDDTHVPSALAVHTAITNAGSTAPTVQTVTPNSASITPNTDTYNYIYLITNAAAGTLTINNDTGIAPYEGKALLIKITSTNIQQLSFGSMFKGGLLGLPIQTNGAGKTDLYPFIYDTVNAVYRFVGCPAGTGF